MGELRNPQLRIGLGIPKLGNKSDAVYLHAEPKMVATSSFTAAL
jgi:hypothetical protein